MNTKLFTQYPNKYKITPKSITKLVIMDWERLKEKTWQNEAMTNGTWYCHLEGCQEPNSNKNFNDEDEFWIGFREDDNKVDFHFTCYGGMCGYEFDKFYDMKEIENWMDLNVQVNTIRWLTSMIDDGILAIKKRGKCMGNLYIMIGVPGSGKDWYIGTHQQDGDIVCSSDGIREELGDVNDQTKNKLVFQMLYERVEKALSEGKNVWFNATNVTVDNRSRAISLGKKYNAKIIGVVMATPTERCISNEDLRDRKVGREVIQKFARRFENPSIEEGFSEIKIIVNGVEVEAD